jgi:predicted  nucleic acid-binding Zn-ribbon protein
MADLREDINVLAAIAKIDKTTRDCRTELDHIPGLIAGIEKKLALLETTRIKAQDRYEAMNKERRRLEKALQDNEELINKYKNQLFAIKKNKEYQAMLKEIETLEAGIDAKEERLLELMDELDTGGEEHEVELKKISQEEALYAKEKETLEERARSLETKIAALEAKKPGLLKSVNPALQKKYERLLNNLGTLPIARIEGDSCGGCRERQPPQLVHEVNKNEKIIACEGCGRILVYYPD